MEDIPESGKVYQLTGITGEKCISNGNSWKESEVPRSDMKLMGEKPKESEVKPVELGLTQGEKINLGTVDIAKRIRGQLKEIKGCKFSVTSEYYSMGSSIHISLMETDSKVIRDFSDIPETGTVNYLDGQTIEQLERMQKERYHQLNPYALRENFDQDRWCNSVFLTEQGFQLLKKVVEIADYYNYDNSDAQTDYYDLNFSFGINLGKWDKPFKDGA